MNSLLQQFLVEARDFLEEIGQQLLLLEEGPDDGAVVGEIFRLVHTLKGNSGLFDMPSLTSVVHAAEDLLDRVRDRTLDMDPELTDALLAAMDFVGRMLEEVEATGSIPAAYAGQSAEIAADLRRRLPARDDSALGFGEEPEATTDPPASGAWLAALGEDVRAQAAKAASLCAVHYRPETDCFFKGDDPLLLMRNLPGLVGFKVELAEPWPEPSMLDIYRCNLVFDALSTAEPGEVEQHLRYVREQVAIYRPALAALAVIDGEPSSAGGPMVAPAFAEAAAACLSSGDRAGLAAAAEAALDMTAAKSQPAAALRWIARLAPDPRVTSADLQALVAAVSTGVVPAWPAEDGAAVLSDAPAPGMAAAPDAAVAVAAAPFPPTPGATPLPLTVLRGDDAVMWREIALAQHRLLTTRARPQQVKGRIHAAYQALAGLISAGGRPDLDQPLQAALDAAVLAQQPEVLAAFVTERLLAERDAHESLTPPPLAPSLAALETAAPAPPVRAEALAAAVSAPAPVPASAAPALAASPALALSTQAEPATARGNASPAKPDARPGAIEPAARSQGSVASSARAAPGPQPEGPGGLEGEPGRRNDGEKGVRVLKVPQEKVDRLMDLIGEMVVAKNALPYLAARAEDHFGSRELGREIKAQYSIINRIAEEMQDGIMQVRMLPVGAVFQRFPRLVRDVARQLGKVVKLVVEGEDTEADKNIVESLADPMIHILRNSLDHGLETPEARRAAGKPEEGRLFVRASQEGDRVLIEVEDDGKGIDPAVIRRKAFEKGVIDEQRLESLTDAEAVQLVFAAGFSTAEQISNLSGRGVGMDVVKSSLEKVGGQVTLTSEVGRGTRIMLSLPLSMSVSNVMMVMIAGQQYGVPMEAVVETVRVAGEDIHVFKGQRTAVLRGRIVPLYGANTLLGLAHEPVPNEDGEYAVLVARIAGQTVGIIVDGFAQTIDVILKPLDGPLAHLVGFSGSALLGDGSVLLVLNLKELI
ncbi:hypothetical protein BJF93_19095 [Xaviernesmea oryzae]|uniref:Chemotaxis protein CheA n=1 Tax=Xaviernesmea oryzae TaxID=464029 RepID=A0A1Q9B1C7_9HYPH|nr:chemotaxis protein CheA [Xaviernesmea oryzae]OLP61802.1 hypothetical protein BJF93_19095 [Xaviernesmea oryzae]SEL76892.1 Signal transducing histidine kinase, homodimeric domain [Xaviernesmea oryzae]